MATQIQDLVVLRYFQNAPSFYVERAEGNPYVQVDLERKVWSYQTWKDIPIGTNRPYKQSVEGIIGVYDSQRILDLNKMVNTTSNIARLWQHES